MEEGYTAYVTAFDALLANAEELATTVDAARDITEVQQAVAESASTEVDLVADAAAKAKAIGLDQRAGAAAADATDG